MKTFRFLRDNLDETVFEHRNKEYGAYELRKSYNTRIIKSFLYALSALTFLSGTPFLIQYFFRKPIAKPDLVCILPVKLDQGIEFPKKNENLIHPPKQAASQPATEIPVTVVNDSLLSKQEVKKDTVPQLTSSNTVGVIGDTTQLALQGSGDPTSQENSGVSTIASSSPFNLAAVDTIPVFPGGESSMMKFLHDNLRFSELAKKVGVEGRVYASFVINSKGEVDAIKIIRGLGYGLDEEVVRVIGIMPNWKPGRFQGRAVSTVMSLPVYFSLVK